MTTAYLAASTEAPCEGCGSRQCVMVGASKVRLHAGPECAGLREEDSGAHVMSAADERAAASGLIYGLLYFLYSTDDSADGEGKKGLCNGCGFNAVLDEHGQWNCDHTPEDTGCAVADAERFVKAVDGEEIAAAPSPREHDAYLTARERKVAAPGEQDLSEEEIEILEHDSGPDGYRHATMAETARLLAEVKRRRDQRDVLVEKLQACQTWFDLASVNARIGGRHADAKLFHDLAEELVALVGAFPGSRPSNGPEAPVK